MKAVGSTGYIEVREHSLFIHRSFAEKSILLREITSISFRPAKLLRKGYLGVTYRGGKDEQFLKYGAALSENAVLFTRSQQQAFEQVRYLLHVRLGL